MPANNHLLILNEKEPFLLYRLLVEARQIKEEEYDAAHDPEILQEINQLLTLTNSVLRIIIIDRTSLSMN